MPFRDINASNINNSTYYASLTEKAENALYTQFPQYANVTVSPESSNELSMLIMDYSREPANYDTQGNIINYTYIAKADFTVNSESRVISVRRTLSAELAEEQCQDSIMTDLVKNYIDKVREKM